MKTSFSLLLTHYILFLKVVHHVIADFPLSDPCLKPCSNSDITATILQTCIDKCEPLGHCCGNRLNGEAPFSSNRRLSCANGCEIAYYYRTTVNECKVDCAAVLSSDECAYTYPNIERPFKICKMCQEGCPLWPDDNACSDGCEQAAELPEFYKYVELPDICEQNDIPRFLFAGQSNMVRQIQLYLQKKYTITHTYTHTYTNNWVLFNKKDDGPFILINFVISSTQLQQKHIIYMNVSSPCKIIKPELIMMS